MLSGCGGSEGGSTSAGLAGDDRVVLLEAALDEVAIPVSLAPIEAGATPEPLPVTLTKGDIIVGAAGADVDGDGDEDVLLSVQDDVRLRVVAMLQEDDATFVEGETVSFETQGDAAQVRRFGDGSLELVSRLDSGLLFGASGLGDGSFAAPVLSTWATEPLSAFAVGALDASVDDDLAVAVAGPGGQSSIEVLIDGGQLPIGALGSDARSLHMDARTGWMITVLDTGSAPLEFGRLQLGVDVDVNTLLLLEEEGATLGSTVSGIDGDGRSDVIALHEDGHLTVVFAASTGGACTQTSPLTSCTAFRFALLMPRPKTTSVRCGASYTTLSQTYLRLVGGWFPSTGTPLGDGPCLEFYLNLPHQAAESELRTEVWAPVRDAW